MDLMDLLKKLLGGEEVTQEEKTFLESFNLQKLKDDAAAAGRKEAEGRLKKVQESLDQSEAKVKQLEDAAAAKADEGATEVQKLQKQLEKVQNDLAAQKQAAQELEQQNKAAARNAKIGSLLKSVKFVEGVDVPTQEAGFRNLFTDLEDAALDDQAAVEPLVKGWMERNKAIILDDSGHGAGTHPKDGSGSPGSPKEVSAKERQKQLAKMS